jgi:hypothetical protein
MIVFFYFCFKQVKEIRTLKFWIKYLLPQVGTYVNKLNLSHCKSLNNNLVILNNRKLYESNQLKIYKNRM